MITGRKDVVARDSDQACQLSKRCAFVVIGMAETEVNAVPLIIKLWMPGPCFLDKFGNLFHLFLIFGSKALEAIGIVNKTRSCFVSHEVDDLGENWLG